MKPLGWMVLLATLIFGSMSTAYAQESDGLALDAETLCRNKIKDASKQELERLNPSDVVTACQKIPLGEDLGVQILSIMIGEPMYDMLEIVSAYTGTPHGMDKEGVTMTLMSPVHKIFEYFNWFWFSVFAVLLGLGTFGRVLRWQKGDFKIGMRKWLGRHGTNYALIGTSMVPTFGWMTPLQFLAVLFIVFFLMIAKAAMVFLFLGAFLTDVAYNIKEDVAPELASGIRNTVLLHGCNIEKREELIAYVVEKHQSRDRVILETDPLFACLMEPAPPSFKLVGESAGNGFVRRSYLPPELAQTESCIEQYRGDYAEQWSEATLTSCGTVTLGVPEGNSASSSASALNKDAAFSTLKSLYFSPAAQQEVTKLSRELHEYYCRDDILASGGEVAGSDSCLALKSSSGQFEHRWQVDRFTSREQLANYVMPMGESTRESMRTNMREAAGRASDEFTSNMNLALDYLSSVLKASNGESPLAEQDIDALMTKIKRGAWTFASVFFDSIQDTDELEKLKRIAKETYAASPYSGLSNWQWINEALNGYELSHELGSEGADLSATEQLVFNAIMPNMGLYMDQVNCWYQQQDCKVVALNPFTELGKRGRQMFSHAFHSFIVARGAGLASKMLVDADAYGQKNSLMLADTFAELYLLYFLLGTFYLLIVPGYPLIKVLGSLLSWCYDVLREVIGIQIHLGLSMVGEQGKASLSNDVREVLYRLVALVLYFLFIVFGMITMFLSFSFFFAFNVLIIGALSNIIGWSGSPSSIESMFMMVVFDIAVAILIFFELKASVAFIDKVPRALSEHFSLKIAPDSNVAEIFLDKIRNTILPTVSENLQKAFSFGK
jgi:hypothetical protein